MRWSSALTQPGPRPIVQNENCHMYQAKATYSFLHWTFSTADWKSCCLSDPRKVQRTFLYFATAWTQVKTRCSFRLAWPSFCQSSPHKTQLRQYLLSVAPSPQISWLPVFPQQPILLALSDLFFLIHLLPVFLVRHAQGPCVVLKSSFISCAEHKD